MIEKLLKKLMSRSSFYLPCPGCGHEIMLTNGGIIVNIETIELFEIKGLLVPISSCRNPLCKWSKVKIDDLYVI